MGRCVLFNVSSVGVNVGEVVAVVVIICPSCHKSSVSSGGISQTHTANRCQARMCRWVSSLQIVAPATKVSRVGVSVSEVVVVVKVCLGCCIRGYAMCTAHLATSLAAVVGPTPQMPLNSMRDLTRGSASIILRA